MQIFHSLRDLTEAEGHDQPAVVTIGNFDGVHRGHRTVIEAATERARSVGARAVAVTFDPHPLRVLRPETDVRLITPLPQKLELLAATGLDATLVLPFTPEFSHWSPHEFAERVLRDALRAVEVHEGENFRFGYHAAADIHGLAALGQELGFTVRAFQPKPFRGAPVSSSRIRAAIAAGSMNDARALLCRPFAIRSTPASGRGYGTRYAVPTVNLAPYPDLVPADGVYITSLQIGVGPGSVEFDGVTNVGNRPTFGADSFAIETHLFNFHPIDLSENTPLELTFHKRLRAEQRFPSPDALVAQIRRDITRAEHFFSLAATLCHRPAAS